MRSRAEVSDRRGFALPGDACLLSAATCPDPSYSLASANARVSAVRAAAVTDPSSQITRSTADDSRATARGPAALWVS